VLVDTDQVDQVVTDLPASLGKGDSSGMTQGGAGNTSTRAKKFHGAVDTIVVLSL